MKNKWALEVIIHNLDVEIRTFPTQTMEMVKKLEALKNIRAELAAVCESN